MCDSHAKARLRDDPGEGEKASQGPLGVFNRRVWRGPAAVEALLAIRPEEAVIDASTPVFGFTPTPSGGACSRPPGRRGSPTGGTSPDTRGGSAWPRTCRPPASPTRADDGGTVEVPADAGPVTERQAAGRGAVARYYQGARG